MDKRRILFILITALAMLSLVEVGSYLFIRLSGANFTFRGINYYTLDESRLKLAQKWYHPTLGWDHSYQTPFGERVRPKDFNNAFMATFGGSFTHCDEVDHHQTWQHYLGLNLQKDIYNFGTGGFGPDQALLKFMNSSPLPKTKIVALAFTGENINRIVNNYRPFYYPRSGIPLTKPTFVSEGEALSLIPNPISKKEDLSRLKDTKTIESLGLSDHWYQANKISTLENYPTNSFPYSKVFINRSFYYELFQGSFSDIRPRRHTLWKKPQALHLMQKIMDEFHQTALARQQKSLFIILPQERDIIACLKGKTPDYVDLVKDYCELRGYWCFDGVATLCQKDGDKEYFSGHFSPKGNQTLAEGLFDFLTRK